MTKKILIILLIIAIDKSPINAQIITTFAGGGLSGVGNGGPATAAQVAAPYAGVFDGAGNFFYAESFGNPRIRTVNLSGTINTVAGNGIAGFSGDNGPATAAKLHCQGVTVDAVGNIYIGDYYNNRIRKVDAVTHVIKTIAGTGVGAFNGDGGPATAADIVPSGLCLDNAGNIYFVDGGGYRVRKINTIGIITTIAGNGTGGFGGDGNPATDAQLAMNGSLCLDKHGNLYLACDTKIRKVDLSSGIITTYAGVGTVGFSGDGGPALSAQFNAYYIGSDTVYDNLYIADMGHDRIYQIDASGIFHWVAGTGTQGFSGDGGPATAAKLYNPEGVTVDSCGNLYIADDANNRIRKVSFHPSCAVIGPSLSTDLVKAYYEFSIFPNPVFSLLTITANTPITNISITNLLGKEVFTHPCNTQKVEIGVAHLPPGMYLLRATDVGGNVIVKKIVKE